MAKSIFVTSKSDNIAELKDHLSEYIAKVESGHSLTLCRRNKPIAKIQPIQSSGAPSALGEVEGWLDDDQLFFENLDKRREISRKRERPNPFLE